MIDVSHAVRQVLYAGSGPVQEPASADWSAVSGASSWIWVAGVAGLGTAPGEHDLDDALLVVLLPVDDAQAEHLGMEGHGRVEVGDGEADVVDRPDARVRLVLGVLRSAVPDSAGMRTRVPDWPASARAGAAEKKEERAPWDR